MTWLRKAFLGLLVASSLLFVTPSTTEAARYGVRGRVGVGVGPYYGRYYGAPYARSYTRSYVGPYTTGRYWGNYNYAPYYRGRVYTATPRVRIVW